MPSAVAAKRAELQASNKGSWQVSTCGKMARTQGVSQQYNNLSQHGTAGRAKFSLH